MDDKIIEAMDAYNYRRWISWIASLILLTAGGYRFAEWSGASIGIGVVLLAFAVAQEIRAAIYPIGMAAIEELERSRTK